MRSSWKTPVFFKKNLYKQSFIHTAKKRAFKVRNRNYRILKSMVNKKYRIYNGRKFKVLNVGARLLGSKLGQFAFTRTKVSHFRKKRAKALEKKKKEELKKLGKIRIVDKAKIAAAKRKRKARRL